MTDKTRTFGRSGTSPPKPWYERWERARLVLSDMHAVSRAKAHAGPDLDDHLRRLAANPEVAAASSYDGSAAAQGGETFARLAATVSVLVPRLPIESEAEDALALAWWWMWSCLGTSRAELVSLSSDAAIVVGGQTITAARIDSRMWRTGTIPPIRGRAADALEMLSEQLLAALKTSPPTVRSFDEAWTELALARLRLLAPGSAALLATLAHLGDAPVPVSELPGGHVRLQPVALADECASISSIRAAVARLCTLGLAGGNADGVALAEHVGERVRALLTPAEERFAAFAAVAAMARLFPETESKPETWPKAQALRAHAFAAAAASESVDVGEGWRTELLQHLSVFESDHGRHHEAVDAARRALTAAERARVGDDWLAGVLLRLADALGHADQPDEAEPLFRRALAVPPRTAGRRAEILNQYASFLRLQGRQQEGLRLQRDALRLLRQGGQGEELAATLHDTSLTLTSLRRFDSSLRLLRCAEAAAPAGTEVSLLVQIRLAATLGHLGRYDAARTVAERVLPAVVKAYGERSWPHVNALHARGIALDALADERQDDRLRVYAEKEYRRYRLIRDELEAHPDDAPGFADDI